jgi:hypothetical protein
VILGGSTEDVATQYLFSVLYDQCRLWGGEVCSNNHGDGEGLPTRTLVFERQKCSPSINYLKNALRSCVAEKHPENSD